MPTTIRGQFLRLILGVAACLMTAAAALSVYEYNEEITQARQRSTFLATQVALQAGQTIESAAELVGSLGRSPDIAALDPDRCKGVFSDANALLHGYVNLISVDRNGMPVCSAATEVQKPVRMASWASLRGIVEDRPFTVGEPVIGALTHRKLVSMATPLQAKNGDIHGALLLSLDLTAFTPLRLAPGSDEVIFILSPGNRVVYSSDRSQDWLVRPAPDLPIFSRDRIQPGTIMRGPDGHRLLVATAGIPAAGWHVVVGLPARPILQSALLKAGAVAGLGILLVVLAMLYVVVYGRRVIAPLDAITDGLARLASGHGDVRIDPTGPAETVAIAGGINRLVGIVDAQMRDLQVNEDRLKQAIEGSNEGIWDWDIVSGHVIYSDHLQVMLGYRPGEVEPHIRAWEDLIHPEDRDRVMQILQNHLNGSTPYSEIEHRLRRTDGAYVWVLSRGRVVQRDPDGRPLRMVGTATDITQRKTTEQQLRLASVVFENSPQAIIVTDMNNTIVAVNPTFTAVTGYGAGESIGNNPKFLSSGRQDGDFYRAMWQSLQETGQWEGEIWNRRKDGTIYCEWLAVTRIADSTGKAVAHLGMFIDITARKEAEARVLWQAQYDMLTELPNRRLLLERLGRALVRARRHHHTGAVLMIDLDHFKEVNDSQGHSTGDALLVEAARRIETNVRESDTVARLGGDEFMVLLDQITRPDDARTVAEKIRASLAAPFGIDGKDFFISASIGISVFPEDGSAADDLIKHADTAMYAAKSAGRNTSRFYTADMQSDVDTRLAILNELRNAVERGQLELFYQPVVDLKLRRVTKAEALIRWRHPDRGLLGPMQFIPLAEAYGMIGAIGDWVLGEAVRQRRAWHDAGLDVEIAVNASADQIRAGYDSHVAAALEPLRGVENPLTVEITETLMMTGDSEHLGILDRIVATGCKIALDDFGTGYSSLSYLARLPAQLVKIDRAFVTDIDSEKGRRLVRTIIDIAHDLNMRVIAEGVETQSQLDYLSVSGCDLVQGYFFAKPLPAAAFVDFVKSLPGPDPNWQI